MGLVGTRGRGDVGMRRLGDVRTWECGIVGTLGLGDMFS